VSDERRADRLPGDTPIVLVDALEHAPPASADVAVKENEERAAVILFTSGTTGFPKGATLSHRSLVANVQSLCVMTRRLPHQIPDDQPVSVTFTSLPLFHIGALQLLFLPFLTGAKLVFLPGRFDASEVLRTIEEERVNVWGAVPTMVERVLAHPEIGRHDTSTVRTIIMGGSPVSPRLLQRTAAAFPRATRGVGQTYGLSEAGGVISTGVAKDFETHPGSVGRIVPVVEIRIDEPDEAGAGEILSRGPANMDGYWGRPDDPILEPDGWLHTGDLGWADDDGFLYVTGRKKDMIIRAGENIAPAHIEAALKDHPGVSEAAVVGLPHPELGEEVGAVIAVAPGDVVSPAELAEFVRPLLARFEVPARWWLRTGDLPKSDSGKVLKYRLREEWTAHLKEEGLK
jgi:long-chain acyl-CoA synthetase